MNRHIVALVLAVTAVLGAVLCWPRIAGPVDVAPVTEGQPATVSMVYDAPMLLVVWVLVTAAGVLAVLGIAGLCRLRHVDAPTP